MIRSLLLPALLAFAAAAHSQCRNDIEAGCSVYSQCFARYCHCAGDPDEYFERYGRRYCEKFLDQSGFSKEGKAWRDNTLRCLQEAIVPKLDISNDPKCNCREMRSLAFRSHTTCYTQESSSICALQLPDLLEIQKVIDVSDTFSSDGWKQMREVSAICRKTAPDDGRRAIWSAIDTVLSLR